MWGPGCLWIQCRLLRALTHSHTHTPPSPPLPPLSSRSHPPQQGRRVLLSWSLLAPRATGISTCTSFEMTVRSFLVFICSDPLLQKNKNKNKTNKKKIQQALSKPGYFHIFSMFLLNVPPPTPTFDFFFFLNVLEVLKCPIMNKK